MVNQHFHNFLHTILHFPFSSFENQIRMLRRLISRVYSSESFEVKDNMFSNVSQKTPTKQRYHMKKPARHCTLYWFVVYFEPKQKINKQIKLQT